jgi:hypothetical protein
MFGFGKKKLDDRLMWGISMEVGMFQSWTLDHQGKDLSPVILEDIIKKILDRENFKYTNKEVMLIWSLAMSNTDLDQLSDYRRKTNFDSNVSGFCKSINLSAEFYTPTR